MLFLVRLFRVSDAEADTSMIVGVDRSRVLTLPLLSTDREVGDRQENTED